MGMKEEFEERRKKAIAKAKQMKEDKRLRNLEIKKKALEGLKDQAYYKSEFDKIGKDLGKMYDKKKSQSVQEKTKKSFKEKELAQLETLTGSKLAAKRRQEKLDEEDRKRRETKRKK